MRNKDFELNLLIIFSWIDLLSRALRVLPVLRVLRVLRVLHCMCIPFRERLPLQPPLGTVPGTPKPIFLFKHRAKKNRCNEKKVCEKFHQNFHHVSLFWNNYPLFGLPRTVSFSFLPKLRKVYTQRLGVKRPKSGRWVSNSMANFTKTGDDASAELRDGELSEKHMPPENLEMYVKNEDYMLFRVVEVIA